ncbi:DUF1289 domain-containing protein [Vibrio sp. V27_P1S3P104]|uniref:DUF1289 domain-containing protein n=1 Tax=unclassified Vibrio TaxID=2614977 RepID=UPI0013732FE0|nr:MULTISPECIES: DUF1289 domain-containing protein [unclassified Vibrio]NAW68466.1 DUF1289 domain-containing protein [Vibrio sp. V28_P6S34P95]NAX04791.1 DUF1289 domain-containing protein [Vibrio sp. V30_P3S12P165]NAX38293.1 DUF1289 domain-containing protein [Vibrio sp. V27_P1S3P104]NAX41081.1 DUF1289 domain-containing protein [Vibrio sp. V26_P1S5P106]
MEQLEFFQIPSPCIGVCVVDDKGYCQGCMRKREERFTWLEMTPAQQLHIIHLCCQRYQRKKRASDVKHSLQVEMDNPQHELF